MIAEAVVATLTGDSVTDEHPNAALVRRVFAAFGRDAKAISAAFARDIVWRVPGDTVMSGEYRGRRDVVEFLRRTGLETGGTYRSRLHTVFADDEWAVAIYRAIGHPQRRRPRRRAGARDPARGRALAGRHSRPARLRVRAVLGLGERAYPGSASPPLSYTVSAVAQ